MAQSTLNVLKRKRMGKSGAREIRKEGNIPAVLYGKGTETLSLVINPAELKEALSTDAGENTLLEIHVKDEEAEIQKLSLLREVQYDYLTDKPIHLDFQALDMKEKITVTVPVQIEGSAKGVKEGGILEEILREISVECLPTNIPNSFSVDVTELEIGHSIHVGTLEIEEGVTILHENEDTIVTVLAPKVETEPTEEEIEGEEGTEEAATEEAQEEGSEEGS
ncbi:MAG: 50S ribosomal protein L25/general stress protein Ctc [Thermodesulfobacteriales bacterium]|nr:MAG: 50S ribosomal protein L25/general stress protein Ctc [Thermodesulfobacteriales bacterium]